MWLWNKLSRLSNFGMLGIVTLVIFWACQVTQDTGHTYLNIAVDSSFTKYDKVTVVVKDNLTGALDTVFDKHLTAISQLSKIPDDNYQGQKVSITITGFRNGQIAYQEVRQYDGQNPGSTTVVVVDSVVAVDSVRLSAHSLILKKGGPAKEISAAVHPANAIQGVLWNSTDENIATVAPKAGDATHALVTPVALGPVMIVVTSQKDPTKTDTLQVTVVDSGVQASSNANLSALTISAGTLDNPAFSPQARVSGTTVANSIATIAITATAEDPAAHLIINGAAAASGVPSAPIALSVGVDSIFVVVTAQDGTLKTYALAITRTASSASNNLLYALTVSTGPLTNPVFNSNNRVSGAIVPNSVDSITVIATLADTLARLTINGTATPTGTPSSRIPLAVGLDSIYVVVTAQDGTQRTYAIGITRAAANAHANANLAALIVSAGPLNAPAFSPATRVSGAAVANSVSSTTVTATVADTTARISINGIPVASGAASGAIALDVGVDSIFVLVTAQDASQKTYVIALTRAGAPGGNGKLATLTASAGALNAPAFNPDSRVSGAAVANSVTSTTVTATVADTSARLTIGTTPTGGTATASGVASAAIPLAVGVDSIYVVVTAQDGSKNTYVVAITRAAPGISNNAKLSALTVSAGTLNAPAFNAANRVSGAAVANTVTSTTVTATVADTTARLTINGVATASGAASAAIPLAVGVDSILIVVTAQDGSKNTYAIGITRSAPNASSNANLSALIISAGTLNAPAFSAATRVSGAAVANSVSSTTVTATVADTTARVTINGVSTASGVASATIPLAVGVDSIFIVVTAQDATQKTYAIGITRAKSANANLSALIVSAGTLNAPAFSAASRVSGAAVANSVSSTTVTATLADTSARLTIGSAPTGGTATASGVASAALPLAVGVDSIYVVVTAQDGTKNTYAIGITRAKSSNAKLSALTLSAGALTNPVFDPTKRVSGMAVANSVASTTVTATLADTSARLTIGTTPTGGTATASGTASAAIPLAVGVDSIYVVVTAQDGTKNTYAIGITKSASSDATLATLAVTPGSITPALTAGTTAYTVNYTTDSTISVKATPSQTGAVMTWNGTALTAGAFSTAIKVGYGSTPFNLVVTAPDGVTKLTYVVTVIRVDNVPPNAPSVTPMSARVYLATPRWLWASGGNGGTGNYRYKFDNPDLSSGATLVTGTSVTPTLLDGPHTIYVQEQDAAMNWSQSGSASTFVMFGPASWYKFDNSDYTDHGFNKNNGTATSGITLVRSPGGTPNGAAQFDGIGALINLGIPNFPTTDDSITLSCWMLTDINSSGYAFWGQLSVLGNTNPDEVVGVVSADGIGSRIAEYPLATPQTWIHVAVTFNGKGMAVFVNGINDVGVADYIGSPFVVSSTIGGGNGRYWIGTLDDVRIYNRVLSAAEISALSNSPP